MRFEQLLYLLDVKKTSSFTKTGQHFYRSQQGISDALRKLEEEWQLTLLNRSKFGVTFTPAGEKLLPYIEELVNDYHRMQSQAKSLRSTNLSGTLTLSVHPRFAHYIFEQSVLPFAKHYPNVTLGLNQEGTSQTTANILSGKSELGIIFLPSNQQDVTNATMELIQAHFCCEKLYTDVMMLCVSQSNPWSQAVMITQQNLATIPLISFEKRGEWLNKPTDCSAASPRFLPETISSSNDTALFKELLKNNATAISITAFEYLISYQNDECFKLIPIEDAHPMDLSLIYLRSKPLSQEAQCLIEIIRHIPFTL